MKYKAIYLPADKNSPKDKVFKSYKDACNYIERYSCKNCRIAVKKGYYKFIYDDKGQIIEDKIPVSDILDTPCGAEWIIEEVK